MSELEIRRLELSDAEAFMVYIANWATDTSPFKIDAVKAYAELSLEKFSDYVEKTHREETFAENPDWSTATKYFAFINDTTFTIESSENSFIFSSSAIFINFIKFSMNSNWGVIRIFGKRS